MFFLGVTRFGKNTRFMAKGLNILEIPQFMGKLGILQGKIFDLPIQTLNYPKIGKIPIYSNTGENEKSS